jgi:putative tricarboxylic transport membrane protein
MHKAVLGVVTAAVTALALTSCANAGGGTSDGDQPDYPTSQITINSPFDPGGGIDLAINTMIKSLTDSGVSDASMRLSNIPGGSGLVATAQLAGDNDGADDTLLLTSVSSLSATIQNPGDVGLDKMTPLGGLYAEYTYIYVPAASPWKTLDDVADAIKADPGSVTFTGASLGSADNIVVAEFAQSLGLDFSDLAYVPLAGDENAAAILGGNSDVAAGGPDLLDLVDSGDVRVLSVSAPERLTSDRVKDIPTMSELGYDVTQANWRGLFGPPNMPQYAIDYWNDALTKLADTQEWKDAADQNVWDLTPMDKDEFTSFMADQTKTLTKVLTSLGLVN